MRKPPVATPPAAPQTASKTASKTTPKTRPRTASAAMLPPPAASAKPVPKAVRPTRVSINAGKLAPAKPVAPAKTAAPKAAPAQKSSAAQTAAPKTISTKAAAKTPPVKASPIKAAKAIPVKAPSSRPVPVRVVAETPATYFAGTVGQAWRLSSRYAVAYVRDAVLAGELLATEPRYLAKAAMAVYYDRKGKAFAWQFRFDTARWAEVVGRLG